MIQYYLSHPYSSLIVALVVYSNKRKRKQRTKNEEDKKIHTHTHTHTHTIWTLTGKDDENVSYIVFCHLYRKRQQVAIELAIL